GGGAGDLHRVFDGFRATGDQQSLLGEVSRYARGDLLAELDIGFVGQHLKAGMAQLGQLLLYGSDHFGVQMTGVEHRNAAGEIDVLTAFDVPHRGVFRALCEDRVNLADATRDGSHAALHQRLVGFAHGVLYRRSGAVQWQSVKAGWYWLNRFYSPRHRYLISR